MLRKIVIVILAAIMCVSGFLMVHRNLELKKEELKYARLQESMLETAANVAEETEGREEEDPAYEPPQALLDIMAEYPDCIGWIDIEGTNVHYPVMQNEDNEHYLHRDMDGNDSVSGCIYMDSEHDISAKGLHTIYGHHMKNGSMFKDIVKFKDTGFMEEHQSVVILTADRKIRLKPVYCYAGKADGTYRQVLKSHGQMIQFIMEHIGQEINADDLYVLVTCSYGSADERIYLYCVPDRE